MDDYLRYAHNMKISYRYEWEAPAGMIDDISTGLRKVKDIKKFCKDLGFSRSYWYGVKNGYKKSINWDTLKRICQALDIDWQQYRPPDGTSVNSPWEASPDAAPRSSGR